MHSVYMSAKQESLHGRGPCIINLGIFVYSYDVYRATLPFLFINYAPEQWNVDLQ